MVSLLYGQFGRGNIGDDLMFEHLRSNWSDEKFVTPFDLEYFRDFVGKISFIESIFVAGRFNNFIIVGGNQFCFVGPRSYLKISYIILIMYLRKVLRKKNILESVGLEYNYTKTQWKLVKLIFSLSSQTSVRDWRSYHKLKCCGIRNIFYRPDAGYQFLRSNNINLQFNKSDKRYDALLFVSHHSNFSIDEICNIISDFSDASVIAVFFQSRLDLDIANEIKSKSKIRIELIGYDHHDLAKNFELFGSVKEFLVQRYHGGIIADHFCAPWKVVGHTDKLSELTRNLVLWSKE